ncbi:MAG TPA: hypothetical protein VM243_20775 [Phycisphaerae bacterium]|nr:hypothetical protein [Phycisphaerae bacterium]
MSPTTTGRGRRKRPKGTSGASAGSTAAARPQGEPSDLREPTAGYALRRRQPGTAMGSLRIVPLVLVSTLVGTAVVLVGPFEHRGTVVFSVDLQQEDADATPAYRTHLLECAAELFSSDEFGSGVTSSVSADSALGTLRLDIQTNDADRGQAALSELTDRFMERLERAAQAARANPTEGERILQDRLTRLEGTLSQATRQAHDTRSRTAGDDPKVARDSARRDLGRHRRTHNELHGRLTAATRELDELRAKPLPERPPINPALRERALLAEVEFQQDRAETRVQLAAARAQLLETWQEASPLLDELIAAAAALEQLGQDPHTAGATGAHRVTLERAIQAAADYRSRLAVFAQGWTREFVALQQDDLDPAAARVLDGQERVTDLLGDFLFEASAALTTVRDQVRELNELSDDQARHHVLVADLTRAFHVLQTAHHQFEFAASSVRTGANFRLAAAVQAARGLARRTQLRLQEIEQGLQQQARQQAQKERDDRIAELEQRCTELRVRERVALEAIFALQDRIDSVTPLADDYVSATATGQAAARRALEIETEIAQTRDALTLLREQRKIPVRPEAVHLISRHVDTTPSNLNRRIAYGWASAATTFVALLLIQWVASTRRT